MENPWKKLEETKDGSLVAADDKAAIGHLQFSHLPQPYMGDSKRAKIFLLYGNPSIPDNRGGLSQENFNRDHKKVILDSYDLDSSENLKKDYPLYALNPAFEKYSIYKWWHHHLNHLITESRLTPKIISEKLFAAQYFPYFPKNIDAIKNIPILKSQEYVFSLVKEAMKAEKIILIMNKRREWYDIKKGVKGLKEYNNVIQLKVPLGTNLARKTIEPGGFDRVLRILKGESL